MNRTDRLIDGLRALGVACCLFPIALFCAFLIFCVVYATVASAAEVPFGGKEATYYRLAQNRWSGEPMPGCFYVQARVTDDLPPSEVGLYWREGDTCFIRLAASKAADPIAACLIVTHEVGHMHGLAHSTDPSSVMYPSYSTASLGDMPICAEAANLPEATTTAPPWEARLAELQAATAQRKRLAARCKSRPCHARARALGRQLASEWPSVIAEAEAEPALI
jgi:hypothetical protein